MKRKDPKFKYNYVMLLDDNDLDNFINQKMIEANHFSAKIYVSTSSKSALEFFSNLSVLNAGSTDKFPQVIFVDINMPLIDGFQFITQLKENFPEHVGLFKFVILTSSINLSDKQKAHDLSSDITFLNKPLTKEMLDQL
jgi:CheY-like chemotaxis protein